MKYYLGFDEKEVTLEELEEIRKNLVHNGEYAEEVLEVWKIEPDALYFTVTLF